MNKKFLAKLLIFCLVFTMLPVSAFAAESTTGDVVYTIAWDTNTAFNPSSVVAGTTANYKANVTYGTGQDAKEVDVNISYESKNTDVATIATDGTLTAKAVDTDTNVDITASAIIGSETISVTKTVTITATEVATVPVTYEANKPNEAAGEVTELPQQAQAPVGKEFTLSTQTPKLDGYVFNGWGKTADATAAAAVTTITIPADSQGVTVYAIWEKAEELEYNPTGDGVVEITGNEINADPDGTLVLDVANKVPSGVDVTDVSITTQTLTAINHDDTVKNVEVKLTDGTLTVPKAELKEKVDGTTVSVTLSIENIINDSSKLSSLPSNVTAKVALEVNITVTKNDGTKDVTSKPFSKEENYTGDLLTVTVANTASLTDVSHVYYVGDDTNSNTIFYNKQLSAKIEGVYIVIKAPHFSQIVLTDTAVTNATNEDETTNPEGPGNNSSGGGGSSSSNVTIASKVTGGTVSISPSRPNRGQTVTINVKPATGYKLDTLTVTDKDGNKLELTKVSDDKYTFVMPAGKVTVTPTFVKTDSTENPGTSTGLTFSDVKADAWYAEYIAYVVEKGMMNGYEDGRFGPNDSTTRAQIVTVLYRLEGEPATSSASFRDVSGGQYYSNAVAWAANNGIVNGYETGAFGPSDNVTREQIAAILYRYAEYKEYDVTATGNVNSFSDSAKVSSWATDAMNWAIGEGLINGDNGALRPQGNATRAEIATLLTRFCENIAK